MKFIFLVSASALLTLAGCSKGSEADNDTAVVAPLSKEDVVAEVNSVKLQPGEWEVVQEVTDVKVTGLPEDVPDTAMTRMIGQRNAYTMCLTPEEAENPSADLFSAQQGADCSFSQMDVSGGKVIGKLSCKLPNENGVANIMMRGDYLPHRYDMDLDVDAKGLPNNMGMTMQMKSSGKWVRECPAGGATTGNSAE